MICKLLLLFMCSTITASDTSPSPALSHKCEGNKCCLLWQPAFCLWNSDKLHPWQLASSFYYFSPHSVLKCSQEYDNRWNWIKMLSECQLHSFASQRAPLGTCIGWRMDGPSVWRCSKVSVHLWSRRKNGTSLLIKLDTLAPHSIASKTYLI